VVLCHTNRPYHGDDMDPLPQCPDRLSVARRRHTRFNWGTSSTSRLSLTAARLFLRIYFLHRRRLHRRRHRVRMDDNLPHSTTRLEKSRALHTLSPLSSHLSCRILCPRKLYRPQDSRRTTTADHALRLCTLICHWTNIQFHCECAYLPWNQGSD